MEAPADWSTACPDWADRIVRGASLMPVGALYRQTADDALDVFGALTLADAPRGPETLGTLSRPWVLEIVETLFGAQDPETKRRRITQYFLCISKKNGKSSIAAGIMLTALILNHRPSAEFLILGPTKEAADNAFKPIRDMIKAEADLQARFHVQDFYRSVTDRLSGAVLKVVAADSGAVTGKKATGVFIDELHEFGKSPKAAHMLTEATGGLASRPEGFVFYCTTQSAEPPAGVFADKLAYARGVRDGRIVDPQFLPLIYEFPGDWIAAEKHRDLSNAYVTNPNWGLSVDEGIIRQKWQEAQEAGEHAVKDFLAKHLNVQIAMSMRADRWAGADHWEACAAPDIVPTLEALLSRCEVAVVGIDGGGLDDLLGLAVIGRDAESGRWLAWAHAWAHTSVLDRHKQHAARLRDFAADGELTIVERMGQDCEEVAATVARVQAAGILAPKGVGIDPSGVGSILDALESEGVESGCIVGISQGWRLTGAIKTAERKLAERALQHGGCSLMAWCVSNARIEPRGNAVLITKQASGQGKIDPLMALLNAVSLMAMAPAADPAPKIYVLEC